LIFLKFNFDQNLNFFLFLVPSLRKKRESGQILVVKRERESWLILIPTMKNVDFSVELISSNEKSLS
jgi:hypothetical protein